MTTADLRRAAEQARERAYAPYSGYRVGAALEMGDGSLFTGANIENAAYPQSICAERAAMVTAASAGHRHLRRVYVITANGGSPCGGCRSVLAEFGDPDTEVILADEAGHEVTTTLGALIPDSFEMKYSAARRERQQR